MSYETFELTERVRRAGRRAAMATLVRAAGKTPRKEGTKMMVGEDGNVFGTVTIGGCVDARVIEQSADVLQSGQPRLLNLDLGDAEAWEIGLTCGGAVDVFIEPVTAELLEAYDAARVEWEAGRTVAVSTVITGAGAGVRELIADRGRSRIVSEGERETYIEVLRPPATLVVFGGSEVAIPLVSFAKALGFRTMVVDGRERFATRERFPDVDQLRVGIPSEIARQTGLGAGTPIVLVAHDYKIDVPVLKHALSTDAPYIGLLGSRRRGAAVLQMLRDEGVAEDQLSRIRTPIGLDLGGDSAAEIALSIVAEVVAVMHGRDGSALTTKARDAVGASSVTKS